MREYHKIETVYKRDPETNFKTLIANEYALPEFGYLANNDWYFTEKVDGTNIRISSDGDRLIVKGRTDNAQIPTYLLDTLSKLFCPKELSAFFGEDDYCLYGEGYGAKIQKGGGNYNPNGTNFVLFDVKIEKWWLKREDVVDIASKLSLNVVPIIGAGTLNDMVSAVKNGITSRWGMFAAEGIVARPRTELMTRGGQRIITKIKTKDFKNEEVSAS